MENARTIMHPPSVNLMIDSVCPSRCKYCFAPIERQKVAPSNVNFISLEDFQYYLNFLKQSGLRSVRIMGGEPLIHPIVREFLSLAQNESEFENITIFTSGLFPPVAINWLKDHKIVVVVNVNSPKDYSPKQHKWFLSNVGLMANEGINLIFGYNIYEPSFDWRVILKLCKLYGVEYLRIAIANPNISYETKVLGFEQRKKIGGRMFSFLMACAENQIDVVFDCVIMPCIFTDEQWGSIAKIFPSTVQQYGECTPVIDIQPDLTVIRCFALWTDKRPSLREFPNSMAVWNFFHQDIDMYKWHAIPYACKCCPHLLAEKCQGGCLAFSYHAIQDLKSRQKQAKPHFALAYDAMKIQNYIIAQQEFESGLSLYYIDPDIVTDYIFLLLKVGKFRKAKNALAHYQAVLRLSRSAHLWMLRGLISETDGDLGAAAGFYRRAMRYVTENRKDDLQKRIIHVLEKANSFNTCVTHS